MTIDFGRFVSVDELKIGPQPPHRLRWRRKRLVAQDDRMAWNLLVKCDDPKDGAVCDSSNVLLSANLGIEQLTQYGNAYT